jgi:carboxymethylenebutenolidase
VSQEKPAGDTGPTGPLTEEAFKALHELRQDDAPPPQGKMVELSKGKAYLSLPQGDPPRPAVLLIHEWWGLNPHIKHWADRLAADGYATLAVDLYGGVVATTRDEAMAAMNAVDDAAAHAVIAEGLRFLAEDPRIRATRRATVGWCFGGAWSLKAALAHPDLSGAVIYYGRLNTDPTALKSIKAPVLGVFGNEDRSIPPDVVNQFEEGLKQAGVKHQILRYDANHAFANPSSNRYDQKAAADAWNKVRAFLKQNLRPGEKADPPETGRVAPTFRLTDHEGRPVEGGPDRKTWTVLAFFPKAATPG